MAPPDPPGATPMQYTNSCVYGSLGLAVLSLLSRCSCAQYMVGVPCIYTFCIKAHILEPSSPEISKVVMSVLYMIF